MASAWLFIMLCVDRELHYCTCCSHDSFWGAFLLLWVTTEENSSLKRCKYVVGLQINCPIRTFVVARWALTVWCVFKMLHLTVISAARTKLAQMNNSFDSWSRFAYKFLHLSKRQVRGNRARGDEVLKHQCSSVVGVFHTCVCLTNSGNVHVRKETLCTQSSL